MIFSDFFLLVLLVSELKAREFEASVPSQLTFVESQEVHVDNEIIKEGNQSMARVYDDLKHLRYLYLYNTALYRF